VSTERSTPPSADFPIQLVPKAAGLDPLPRPPTSFVGRERELDAITTLLAEPALRLVTLTGPGGAGKTRLAIATARRLEPTFHDGVVFAPFEATTEVAQVPALIAQAAGVPDSPGRSLAERMRDAFQSRAMLLVLDNLEHLPGVDTHVTDLLSVSEHLKVLCTSRGRLGVAGEQVYPVPPLARADAITLFVQRARAVEPDAWGDDRDLDTVAHICERLEDLPLAIELAAARTNVLSLAALLARLEHQLPLLADGPRNAAARHRTMRDTIAWSHDLLGRDDQVLLRRLGVFVGGFSLDAARIIANDGIDALEGVSHLVASGLVRRMPGPADDARFRLPVPVREYVWERLGASDELEAVRTRHSWYYRDLTEEAIPHYDAPEMVVWSERIHAERDNCRAAMTWAMETDDWETAIRLAGALWRTWWWHSQAFGGKAWTEGVTEGLSWIERTLPHRQGLPVEVSAEALIGAGVLTSWLDRLPEADASLRELLRLSETQDYPYGEYWACLWLGIAAQEGDNLEGARRWLERALDRTPEMRNTDNHAAQALGCLAEVAKASGDDHEALRLAAAGLDLARTCGNPNNISRLGLIAGRLHHTLGDPGGAVPILIESTEAYAVQQDLGGVQAALTELGQAALALNQVDTATKLLVAAHSLPAQAHDRPIHDAALVALATRLKTTPDALVAGERAALELDDLPDLLALAQSLATVPSPSPDAPPAGLTPREFEVLRLLAEGHSNRAIADHLSLSERTIENHVLHILTKVGVDSRTAAAAWAIRTGLA